MLAPELIMGTEDDGSVCATLVSTDTRVITYIVYSLIDNGYFRELLGLPTPTSQHDILVVCYEGSRIHISYTFVSWLIVNLVKNAIEE